MAGGLKLSHQSTGLGGANAASLRWFYTAVRGRGTANSRWWDHPHHLLKTD